jgi:hypothetical protein
MARTRRLDRQKCVISHPSTKKVEAPYQSQGGVNQWLTRKELKRGIKRDDEAAQSFVDNQRALELLVNTINNFLELRTNGPTME